MNALVISGGGSKGAFAGGVSEYLLKIQKKEYKLFVGTSTGSLLIPFLALGDIEKIKKIYCTIKQEDIFSVCPIIIKKKNGVVKTGINHLGIIKQFFKRQKTLGDSTNLRLLIKKSFTEKDFEKIRALGKEIVVTVANLTTHQIEHKSSNDCSYDDFCDWMWASANLVPLMSLVAKNGCEYADGGFGNLIPIEEAIRKGATTIDVIVLKIKDGVYNNPPLRNALDVFFRTYDFMLNQIAMDDILIANLEAASQNVTVSFYHINRVLTTQSYIFNAEDMKQWWQEGYEMFQSKECTKHYLTPKKLL